MITEQDRKILKEVGREYLLDIALDSKLLKEKLTFKEHVSLCDMVTKLTYEEVISLTVTEDIRSFEGKFSKFLKYSLAAIAGMAFSAPGIVATLAGPPVAMFILYLFRKATDTCNLACIKKFPLSTEKKICKAECKVIGAKRIVDDLHKEISKCSQFEYADKCEKKLQKEYIKWSRRLQQLMVKLNQAKLGRELKARRAASKAQRVTASYQIPKSQIVKMISESSTLREKLNFRNHIKLYHTVLKEEEFEVTPPKVDPKKEKMARQILYLGLWIIPIPFFNDLINYLVKKYSFSCMTKCMQQKKYPKTVCYNQCSYLSTKYAVDILNKNLKTCNKAKDPVKCKKKVYGLLEDWKQREVEAKIKFESSMRQEIRKAKSIQQQQNRLMK